jgi:hypothetical protein
MTLINPPAWMQAGSYPARTDRLALTALLAYPGFLADEATPMRIRQGIKPSYTNQQLKVRAAPTPNMTVIVSGGFGLIDQHDTGGVGTYIVANDADVVLTVAAAGGAGQFRKDTVVLSVYDQEYVGSVSEARLEIIQGPYAASAGATVRGTLPSNAQILADIAVAPSQTSVSAANITDVRQYTVAAGGIVPTRSSSAPTRPHPGQALYLMDTDVIEIGQEGGTKRQVREVVRPSVSDQVSMPSFSPTGSFVDFTSGQWPPINVTVPPSGQVKVTVGAAVANTNSSTSTAWATWRASGATTYAASEKNSVTTIGGRTYASRVVVLSGMTPGNSLTITPQWNVSSAGTPGSVTRVSDGQLIVEPIA